MSRYALDALDLAIQKFLEKWRSGRRVILDPREGLVYHHRVGRNDRLGSLEKRILIILS